MDTRKKESPCEEAALIACLRSKGCELLGEGGRHPWWHDPAQSKRSAIPRHSEIQNTLARKICRDLGLPPIQ
ncbi:MAG: type II toxin-antitoxin system HicA family toxin [Proteobacteria bacterium]|nr:type II toxin-antitoxin system HicA family toxin [Pseudomonadota bacterium]